MHRRLEINGRELELDNDARDGAVAIAIKNPWIRVPRFLRYAINRIDAAKLLHALTELVLCGNAEEHKRSCECDCCRGECKCERRSLGERIAAAKPTDDPIAPCPECGAVSFVHWHAPSSMWECDACGTMFKLETKVM